MAKRTQKEIEKDCKRIKEAAKTATSIKELEQATGLSYAMINTTLSKHPIIFKRIKEQLDINLANREKAKSETKKQTSPAIKGIETSHVSTADNFSGFVIDASISGVENIKERLLKICNTNKKIILTSITIKELENLQKSITLQGKDARYFLALAAENPKSFVSQLIDETIGIPDDCIIKYCADNKDKFILLTSDKTMALKARMYGVEVQYFKKTNNQTNSKVETSDTNANLVPKATPVIASTNSNVRTLIPAKKIGNKLVLSDFHTDTRSIRVYSDRYVYNNGTRELKIGDNVFIASKKDDCITFAHYKMISVEATNNCELIFSRRIYDYSKPDLPKIVYKNFFKDFLRRHDL